MVEVRTRRVYEAPLPSDGTRVLIDRLWPRGLSKEKAGVDHWLRELAPSNELRRWYGHRPELWDEFRRRYFAELDEKPAAVDALRRLADDGPVTLVFGARAAEISNAAALVEYLRR